MDHKYYSLVPRAWFYQRLKLEAGSYWIIESNADAIIITKPYRAIYYNTGHFWALENHYIKKKISKSPNNQLRIIG